MADEYTPEAMRKKFWELQKEKEDIQKRSAPLRKKRDDALAKARPYLDEAEKHAEEYLKIERPRLGEIDRQLSALTRALGNRVGERPE